MPEPAQFDAGIFALTAEGWKIVDRKISTDQMAVGKWVQRKADAMAQKNPSQPVRGSVVTVGSWMTLEWVLGDYESKRKAGDPEFNEHESNVFTIGGKITASYTARQGQYLAFIYSYTKLNDRPPAEADMQQYFKVSPPAVHDMIVMLERKGLIARTPGIGRSIRVLLPREQLPALE